MKKKELMLLGGIVAIVGLAYYFRQRGGFLNASGYGVSNCGICKSGDTGETYYSKMGRCYSGDSCVSKKKSISRAI